MSRQHAHQILVRAAVQRGVQIDVADGRIQRVYSMLNPDKLGHLIAGAFIATVCGGRARKVVAKAYRYQRK